MQPGARLVPWKTKAVVKIAQTSPGSGEQDGLVLNRRHAEFGRAPVAPQAPPQPLRDRSPFYVRWRPRKRGWVMASNSSAKELRAHAEIFRRWANETDFPEMREEFLSLAAGIADQLICSGQARPRAVHSAARSSPRGASTVASSYLHHVENRSLASERL